MPAPLSIEVREAIVRAHEDSGLSYREVSALLGVCDSTVTRVLRRRRLLGGVAPLPRGGGNFSPIAGAFVDMLHELVAKMPDATIAELTEALIKKSGQRTSRSAVVRALQRLGYTRKKRVLQPPSATPTKTSRGAARTSSSSR